jgi:hypothetical protein
MSLPKHHTSTLSSSSSSKQSLRGNTTSPSRPRTIHRQLSGQQQQQQPDHATASPGPAQTANHSGQLEGQQQDAVNPPEPEFQPFFTLIEDANSSEYYHPTVHYVFSDDDPELVTEAALRALETGGVNEHSRRHEEQSEQGYIDEGSEMAQYGSRKQSLLPPPIPGVKERYIILDVEPSVTQPYEQGPSSAPDAAAQVATAAGAASMSTSPAQQRQQNIAPQHSGQAFRITSAHSLTPDWQVLNTQLGPAPSFDTLHNNQNNTSEPSSNGALMLRIEGTAGFPRDIAPGRGEDNRDHSLEEMMEQFEKRMGELRRVIEAGGGCPPNPRRPSRTGLAEETDRGNSENDTPGRADKGQEHDGTTELRVGESHQDPAHEE